jgi:hypothetical protein
MGHATMRLVPGVDQNRTPTLNEAAISSCNLIRFQPDRQGMALPQKLGGWTKFYNGVVPGVPRNLWAWQDAYADPYLAIGSTTGLYAVDSGGALLSISGQYYTVNKPVSVSTTAGSATVTIVDDKANILSGDTVFIKTQIAVGGLVLFGNYQCTYVDSDTYQIEVVDAAGYPVFATSTVSSGGAVPQFATAINSNIVTVTLANHDYQVNQFFPVLVPTTFNGVTLSGNYVIQSVTGANTFTINASNSATAASSASINSGLAQYEYYLGNTVAPSASGFGTGEFGIGTFGIGTIPSNGREYAIVNVQPSTPSAGFVTYTIGTSGNRALIEVPAGSEFTVSGVIPSNYNSINPFSVVSSTRGSLSGNTSTLVIASTETGAYTSGGKLTFTSYATGSATDWSLGNWGETLISCPRNNGIYQWDPQLGSESSALIPTAPIVNQGMFIAMPQRQIVAYGSTYNGIQQPLLVRWCDIGNFNIWSPQVTNQAGSYIIPKGSRIVGGIQGPQQGLIWTDLGVWAMQYVSQPYIYQFNEIGAGCGMVAEKAAGAINGDVYWMGLKQFFKLAGSGVEPVNCPVWDVVFQNLNMDYADNIRVAVNSSFHEIAWYYPSNDSVNGENDSYVKLNVLINQWDYGTLDRSAWLDQSVLGQPIGASPTGYIYQHEMSLNADDQPMASSFRTGFFQMSEAELKMFVDQVWPDMKWGYYNGAQNANVGITFHVADYPDGQVSSYGPYNLTEATTYITPRFRGRLVSIEISSNDLNTFWRLGGIRYRLQPDGKF